jgi:hypothetical protein
MADKRAPEYSDHPASEAHGRPVLTDIEARQAKPLGVMRYVLVVSLTLVIIGFAVAYLVHGI